VRHLYVHVPFCRRRCSYCDFAIAVRRRVPGAAYVEAVARELAGLDAASDPLDTLYFGGGTPSLLAPALLAELVDRITRRAPLAPDAEVTLEANPEDVTAAAAAAWRAAGVNRVSLGAQSFDERVLGWMHRSHGAARIGAAVALLRDAGIANLSLDLIFAVPEGLARDWSADLEQAIALAPDHLSLYGLAAEPRTPLERWLARGATRLPDDERYAAEYLLAHELLGRAGYEFYEVSNAARSGRRARHNAAYWTGAPYVGLGPAAHSFDGRSRHWNLGAWEAYRAAVAAGGSPVEHRETLTPAERELEQVYLGLRSAAGAARAAIPVRRLQAWEAAGWVTVRDDRVVCGPEGWLRLDALVGDLTRPAPTL
jgi:oxygen-independent coproporphyrinogen-3 oxidase